MDVSAMLEVPATAFLTVDEAACVLRAGRSLGYQLGREYGAAGGVSGLSVIRVRGCLRVLRWALLEWALTGWVVPLCDAVVPAGAVDVD